jgi:hypothetical protein
MVGTLVLLAMIDGMIEASTLRSPAIPARAAAGPPLHSAQGYIMPIIPMSRPNN